MSSRYTSDGKRRSSQTHARYSWTCDCGRAVFGNGGKASHQRACDVWARAELARLDRMLDRMLDRPVTTWTLTIAEQEARYEALRKRLGETS